MKWIFTVLLTLFISVSYGQEPTPTITIVGEKVQNPLLEGTIKTHYKVQVNEDTVSLYRDKNNSLFFLWKNKEGTPYRVWIKKDKEKLIMRKKQNNEN